MLRRFVAVCALVLGLGSGAQAACTAGALPFNLQNNTIADATQVMANFNQILSGVAANCAGSGANSDITSLGGLTTPLSQSQGGTWWWVGGTSTGSANAQVVATVTPSTGFSLTQGKCVQFTAGFSNSGATQINIFGTGLTNLFRQSPSGAQTMTGGEVVANNQVLACYDGTQFELVNPQGQFGGFGPLTTLVSSTTTDLGTIGSHNVNVTGVVTITSFGSSASTTYPYYRVTFAGALTLTYNASSLIIPGAANLTTAANDTAELLYLGSGNWQVTQYTKANGTASVTPTPLDGFRTLTLLNNAGTPTTQADWRWNAAVLINSTGNVPIYFGGTNGTVNLTTGTVTATCNGMDGEARGTSQSIYFWAVSNGSSACVIGSLSSSAPTLPSGYVYQAYLGAMYVDGSGNLLRTSQRGNKTRMVPLFGSNTPIYTPLASANVGLSAWSALSVPYVPGSWTHIAYILNEAGGATIAVTHNTNIAPPGGGTANGIPCQLAVNGTNLLCELERDGTLAYVNSSTSAGVYLYGWTDGQVNAN